MAAWTSKIEGWIFPAGAAYDASTEIADGRVVYILKPQYYFVTTGAAGTITQMTTGSYAANGYSVANAALIKKYSTKQFVTISCNDANDMDAICGNGTNTTNVINQLVAFLQLTGFTGIELDWENFTTSGCTALQYTHFLSFVSSLSTSLHSNGFQLMVDGPSINNNAGVPVTDGGSNQASYRFKYEDVAPYCDYVLMQIYDDQFEYGCGTSISPQAFIINCCAWLLSKVGSSKAVAGMPAYGYFGSDGLFVLHEDNYNAFSGYSGFGTATRNADFEMNWQTTPSVVATGAFANGATSGTLNSAWTLPTGNFHMTFSNGNARDVNFTNGSTAITWSVALVGTATATITATPIDFYYMDQSGMNSKRTLIEAQGILHTSTWYIGGNQWFNGKTEPTNPSSLTDIASLTNCASIFI